MEEHNNEAVITAPLIELGSGNVLISVATRIKDGCPALVFTRAPDGAVVGSCYDTKLPVSKNLAGAIAVRSTASLDVLARAIDELRKLVKSYELKKNEDQQTFLGELTDNGQE